MASEAGRGNEYNAFSIGSPPEHETILPFTRLMGGPMDYTPGIFKMKGYSANAPDRQMHTTLCKQLALYVTLYSPLQMAADLPENYEAHKDAFQFIKDVTTDWDDTQILGLNPEIIFISRGRKREHRIGLSAPLRMKTNGKPDLNLSFLDKEKKYTATIYRDAPDADWKDNPEAYMIEQFIVDNKTNLDIALAPGGGAGPKYLSCNRSGNKKNKTV